MDKKQVKRDTGMLNIYSSPFHIFSYVNLYFYDEVKQNTSQVSKTKSFFYSMNGAIKIYLLILKPESKNGRSRISFNSHVTKRHVTWQNMPPIQRKTIILVSTI